MRTAFFSMRRYRCVFAALVVTGFFIIVLQREAVLSSMGRWLNVAGKLAEPVDAVMVLGGAAKTRPFVAVEVVRAGLARKVLIPQVELSDENRDGLVPTEQDVLRRILLRSGVAPDAVVLLTKAVNSTEQEAQVAAAYLLAHPDERLAVVTSDFHTRRARFLFSRACSKNSGNLIFIAAPADDFDASNWWHCESGLISYLDEYLKLGWALVH